MNINKKVYTTKNEISEIYIFSLGGISQKVLIEGKSKELPVVINLHGGPGSPIPFSVGCRGLFPIFTDNFIMVYWDQLGCGINNYKLGDEFGVESFVKMTEDLITEVKKIFPTNKIIIFGMSWGSVLALKSLGRINVKVDAVLIWGQVFRKLIFNEEVYTALENAGLSAKKMQRIRDITIDNFNNKDMQFLVKNIRKYTDGYFNKKDEKTPIGSIIKGLFMSPDYKFKDFKAIMINETAGNTRLWPELLKLDLTKELLGVNIPYYILQGDTDIVTSTVDIKRELELHNNPNLHLRIIENSGHIPGKSGMDAVLETLTNIKNQKGA